MAIRIDAKRVFQLRDPDSGETRAVLRVADDNSFSWDIITDQGHIRGLSRERLLSVQEDTEMLLELMEGLEGLQDSEEPTDLFAPIETNSQVDALIREVVHATYAEMTDTPREDLEAALSELEKLPSADDKEDSTEDKPSAEETENEITPDLAKALQEAQENTNDSSSTKDHGDQEPPPAITGVDKQPAGADMNQM